MVFQSGYPNDEARGYHPLAAFGLDTVTIGRVKDSEWVKEVTDQNKKGWPNTDYSAYEHYIYSFKETTFEMIAQDVSITVSDQSLSDVKKEITEWLESVIE